MRVLLSALFVVSAGPVVSWAQLTPQQAISYQQARDLSFSPNDRSIVFSVAGAPKGKGRPQDIWLADIKSTQLTRLTQDGASDSPQWSPDGQWVAYLSSAGDLPQIYLTRPGAEATQLSHHLTAIRSFEWSADGKHIAFLAAVNNSPVLRAQQGGVQAKQSDQDPLIVKIVSGSDVPVHLWVLDLQSHQEREVTSGTFDVAKFAWKHDGSGLVAVASERPDPEHWSKHIYSVALADGAWSQLVATQGPLGDLKISPDGTSIAYLASRRGEGEAPSDLYVVPIGGGTPLDLTEGIDRTVQQFQWKDKGDLLVLCQSGFTNKLYTIPTQGKATEVTGFDPNAQSFAASAAGEIAYVRETASELPEVWIHKAGRGAPRQLTQLNAAWKTVHLAKGEIVRYTSYDGLRIEGQLLRPTTLATGRFPTIILVHGGPVGRWADKFDPEGQLLAARGYAVFYPNIRGASSYGERMIELIRSPPRGGSGWGTGPLADVIAAADALVQQGIADPARLAMGGWSYGGYMTALALSRTDKFKVGVAGAGFYDMVTDLGSEIASYVPGDEWMYGNFYDAATQKLLHDDSPIATIRRLRAPLLVMHPEFDPVDTIGQAYELYRALKQQGVSTDFIIYPREGHELREEAHILDRLTRTVAWYDRYLKDSGTSASTTN